MAHRDPLAPLDSCAGDLHRPQDSAPVEHDSADQGERPKLRPITVRVGREASDEEVLADGGVVARCEQ